MHDMLNLLLALLGVGQVVTGFISWYFGMQVKMLRLELVNKEVCQARHDKLLIDIGNLYKDLAHIKAVIGGRRA